MSAPDAPQRLVIRLPNWLGDAVMALPALTLVRSAYPGAFLALAGQPSVLPVFEEDTSVHPQQLLTLQDASDTAALREGHFDAVLLLTNSFRSAWGARQSGIRERWGYAGGMRGPLLTKAVRRPKQIVHQSQYYFQLVEGLGIVGSPEGLRYTSDPRSDGSPKGLRYTSDSGSDGSPEGLRYTSDEREALVAPPFRAASLAADTPARPRLAATEPTRARARRLLDQHGITPETLLVGFAPGAAYGHAKRWPPDRVAHVIERLARERGARAVLVGAGSDREAGRAIESTLPPSVSVANLIGRTDLRQLMGVISECRAFVSNDSGAMHLAAALGVPVTAIFGPTNERATSPLGEHEVLLAQVFCRPCMLRECPIDHRCMKRISEENVYSALIRRMDRHA